MGISKYAKIFRPLDYLRVKHSEKRAYDLVIPLILAVAGSTVIVVIPGSVAIFGPDSLVSLVSGLAQILTGFFIASLAAVATFNKEGMDAPMLGTPPTLVRSRDKRPEQLSRRRFLSLMFGYLAFVSLLLYLIGGFAQLLSSNFRELIQPQYREIAKMVFVFAYFLVLFNMITTTLLGLYYMADRIHRRNPEVRRNGEVATIAEYPEDDDEAQDS